MTDEDMDAIDFFTDRALGANPYPWFEHLRARCPVAREPVRGTLAVTGYDEALEVYRNTDDFSSCNSAIGPFAPLPGTPEGDDIGGYIAEHRDQLPMHEHFVTMDPPEHTRHRSLPMRLLTPRRMRDNEQFMWDLAGRQLDEFAGSGSGDFTAGYAQPFTLLVVADLLGVPAEHHDLLRRKPGHQRPGEMSGKSAASTAEDHQWDSLNPSSSSTSSSSPTSSSGDGSRSTTCSPSWRWPRSPTAPCPSPSRCRASPRSCSAPARRPPRGCWPPR